MGLGGSGGGERDNILIRLVINIRHLHLRALWRVVLSCPLKKVYFKSSQIYVLTWRFLVAIADGVLGKLKTNEHSNISGEVSRSLGYCSGT